MNILAWIILSASLTFVIEAAVCVTSRPDLVSYGSSCNVNSQCQTNYCLSQICTCPSDFYYSNCSRSCVHSCNTAIYTNTNGFLVSPNYPYNYNNNDYCYWTIRTDSGNVISFTLTDYSIQDSYDGITIYDGSSQYSPLIGRITLSNNTFVSRSSYMHIVFRSDSSGTYSGFNGTFQVHECTKITSVTHGEFSSPGYPNWSMRYGNCKWTITGQFTENFVIISFHNFDLGPCTTSKVSLTGYNNNVLYGTVCNSNTDSTSVNVSTYGVVVQYTASKNYVSYKGFNATYLIYSIRKGYSCKISQQCKASLTCVNGVCDCTSTQYYDSSSEMCLPRKSFASSCTSGTCETYLTCLNGACSCSSNSLYHDSTTKTCKPRQLYGSSCSNSLPCETYLTCLQGTCGCSSDNYYHDASTKSCKPRKSYGTSCTSIEKCETYLTCLSGICSCASSNYNHSSSSKTCIARCNTTIYSTSIGFLVSPNYPYNYVNNLNCYWTIYTDSGSVISFTLTDFIVEESYDTITVYDGNSHYGTLLGRISLRNNTFVSRSSSMHIVFRTDSSGTRSGFNGTFQVHACTKTTSNTYGEILSPGYPNWSMRYGTCKWTIIGSFIDNFILISFHNFDLGPCTTSKVSLTGYNNYVLYGTVCNFNSNSLTYNVSTYGAYVQYTASKDYMSYRGFNATYLIYSLRKGNICKLSQQCKSSLTCVNGVCDCISTLYYDSSSEMCLPRKSYGSYCSSAICETYLTCLNYACNCPNSAPYHDSATKTCKPRQTYGSSCSNSLPCETYLTCLQGTCSCSRDNYYHDASTKSCKARKSYGTSCTSSMPCETYLTCLGDVCNCSSDSYFHNPTSKSCIPRKSYASSCTSGTCETYLSCLNGICDCSGNAVYHDSTNMACKPRNVYGSSCTSETCQTYLACVSGICNCSSTSDYHDSYNRSCMPKRKFGEKCSSSIQCQTTLYCNNSQCLCPSGQFYDPRHQSCTNEIGLKEICATSIEGMCKGPNLQCMFDVSGSPRCLCKEDLYEKLGNCQLLSELKVTRPVSRRRSTNSLELWWTPNPVEANVAYHVIVTPVDLPQAGQSMAASDHGVNLTDLIPGAEYNITIVTQLPGDRFYTPRRVGLEYRLQTLPSVPGLINTSRSILSHAPYQLSLRSAQGYVYLYKLVVSDGGATLTYQSNSTVFTVADLKADTFYFYSITAYNKNGDYSEAVIGSFKTDSHDDTNELAAIIGPSISVVILIIIIALAVVFIRRRRNKASKPKVEKKVQSVVKISSPKLEPVSTIRQNSYKKFPKADPPVPARKPVVLDVNHIYEEYGAAQFLSDKTESSTDAGSPTTKRDHSSYNNVELGIKENESVLKFKDDEVVYQNLKPQVKAGK